MTEDWHYALGGAIALSIGAGCETSPGFELYAEGECEIATFS